MPSLRTLPLSLPALRSQPLSALLYAMFLCIAVPYLSADVLITEFMARNSSTIDDGDGASSDWIELHNSGSNTVDLTGWYLSDDETDPRKWRFPSTNIAAGAYLLVFASGQDTDEYVDSLGYLHTTYRLSSNDGEQHESVVLTASDGVTVVDVISDYPKQDRDISYGRSSLLNVTPFVLRGSDARGLVPIDSVAGWYERTYDDAFWLSGVTGAGYEHESGYGGVIGLDVGGMRGVTPSAYIRIPFVVSSVSEFSSLAFRIQYDDGFAAWLNGVPLASANAPALLQWNSSATANHEANLSRFDSFTVPPAAMAALVAGTNVLAIQGLNASVNSSDLLILPELRGVKVDDTEPASMAFLTTPSPGEVNSSGVDGYVADTTFSVKRGVYSNAFDVAISCKTAGAEIYYSLNGSEPTPASGTAYIGAVHIARTTILRAAAYKTGFAPSDIDTQTYLFPSDVAMQSDTRPTEEWPTAGEPLGRQTMDYGMDPDVVNDSRYSGLMVDALRAIPSISLVSELGNFFDEMTGIYMNPWQDGRGWERDVSVELLHPDGSDGFQIDGGMRIRGGVSRMTGNPKHSFRLFFRTEYGTPRLRYDLFGDEGADSYKRLDLRTGQNFSWAFMNTQYATWLYDVFTRDVHREMGQPYARSRYYHLYLNGVYWGLYQSEERPDARFGESYFGGDSDDYDTVKADAGSGRMYAADGTTNAYCGRFRDGIDDGVTDNAVYFRLQGMNADGTRNPDYPCYLDVDNVIDYMLTVFYTGNRDSPLGPPGSVDQPRNCIAVFNRNDPVGFQYIAHDSEFSLEVSQADALTINRVSVQLGPSLDERENFNPWWLHVKLTGNTEYKMRLADRIHRHFLNDGVLTPDVAGALFSKRKAEIDLAVIAESARWGDAVTIHNPYTRDDDWLPVVDSILNHYIRAAHESRTEIVLNQLKGAGLYPGVAAPVFAQHGGLFTSGFALSISSTDSVYYTLDGSDPRAIGGGIAGALYSTPLPLTRNTVVKARAFGAGGVWSALTEAVFTIDTPTTLRVTEIMYHPAAPSPAQSNLTANSHEFIELLNTGTQTVGLAGIAFTNGIRFDFTEGDVATLDPGEYVVLVQDIDGFKSRHTNWHTTNIAGEYRGRFFLPGALDDAGETLALRDGAERTIQSFRYDDDWYVLTDGDDFSLTLLDAQADAGAWSNASSWRASARTGGTPGRAPEAFISADSLVINEVLSHQDHDNPGDWIELYNAGTNTLDINGWFLSDDEDEPTKIAVSNVAAILPGSYAVLTEHAHFGTNAVATNGFAFSELGDAVCLTSGESGVMTGYRDYREFEAAPRDETYGRHLCRDGTVDFAPMRAQSSGSGNTAPRVGPVVISEIHYHPSDSNAFEFIELHNTADTSVPLYDVSYPSNTWRLRGAVRFSMPTGVVMAAGETLLVAPTNAAAFTNMYTVPSGTRVLSPYEGMLNNAGERLSLKRPGDPDPVTGDIPWIPVEWVDYDSKAPWPTEPDGGGSSLLRVELLAYANDGVSWAASTNGPTPGVAAVDNSDRDGDGMPDTWEITHFGSTNAVNGGSDEDRDGDGASNREEWYAGTDPTNAMSVFSIDSLEAGGSDCVLRWHSASGRFYRIWRGTNLAQPLGDAKAGPLPATPPENVHTVGQDSIPAAFYRISVEQ